MRKLPYIFSVGPYVTTSVPVRERLGRPEDRRGEILCANGGRERKGDVSRAMDQGGRAARKSWKKQRKILSQNSVELS